MFNEEQDEQENALNGLGEVPIGISGENPNLYSEADSASSFPIDAYRNELSSDEQRGFQQVQRDQSAIQATYGVESVFDSRPINASDFTFTGELQVRRLVAGEPGQGLIEFDAPVGFVVNPRKIFLTPSRVFFTVDANGSTAIPFRTSYLINNGGVDGMGNIRYDLSKSLNEYDLFMIIPKEGKLAIRMLVDLPAAVPVGEGVNVNVEITGTLILATGAPPPYEIASKRDLVEDDRGNVIFGQGEK